jgi:preprotein translocase subunit YajC
MLISQALAATDAVIADPAAAPATTDTFMWNMGMVALMFVLFYVLMIRPQQKRLRAQQATLSALKVGDKVVTGGGLVGTISKLTNDTEVEVDLGTVKVTALRFTLNVRNEPTVLSK